MVETTNAMKGWFDMVASLHSDALRVVERYTISDPDNIGYEATIEDPKVFTKPWRMISSLTRAPKDYELFEYACQEGNHVIENAVKK